MGTSTHSGIKVLVLFLIIALMVATGIGIRQNNIITKQKIVIEEITEAHDNCAEMFNRYTETTREEYGLPELNKIGG